MQDVNWAPTVWPISIFLVARYLPLALLTPLSALCVEAVAQPQNESTKIQANNTELAELVEQNQHNSPVSESKSAHHSDEQRLEAEISEEGASESIEVMEPLVLSQSNDSASESEDEQDEEDSWRVYLDLYAFAPLSTNTTTQLNGGNPVDAHSSLVITFTMWQPMRKC